MGVDLDDFVANSMWTSYLPAFQSCCGPQQGEWAGVGGGSWTLWRSTTPTTWNSKVLESPSTTLSPTTQRTMSTSERRNPNWGLRHDGGDVERHRWWSSKTWRGTSGLSKAGANGQRARDPGDKDVDSGWGSTRTWRMERANQVGVWIPLEAQGHRTDQQGAVPGTPKNSWHRSDPWKTCGNDQATFQKKARLVACGNQASKNEEAEVAAGGLCTVCTRSWGCATVDVKTAFLQAPRREEKGKLTLVTPPAITKEAQVCGQEWWLVKGALCRLVESPKDWAVYRDATCKTISWKGETGQHRRLAPTPEPHVWSIEEMEKTSNGEKWFVIGNMGVYVDDLLIVAPDNILEETLKALEERFTLATREWVTGRKLWHFVAMKSQRLTRAMRWDKRNTSATSLTSTTSNKQQGSRAQRLKKDQKNLLRTSLDQSWEEASSCAGSWCGSQQGHDQMWRTRWGSCQDCSIRGLAMWWKLDSNAWNTFAAVHQRSSNTRVAAQSMFWRWWWMPALGHLMRDTAQCKASWWPTAGTLSCGLQHGNLSSPRAPQRQSSWRTTRRTSVGSQQELSWKSSGTGECESTCRATASPAFSHSHPTQELGGQDIWDCGQPSCEKWCKILRNHGWCRTARAWNWVQMGWLSRSKVRRLPDFWGWLECQKKEKLQSPRWWALQGPAQLRHQLALTQRWREWEHQSWGLEPWWTLSHWCLVAWPWWRCQCTVKGMGFHKNKKISTYIMDEAYYQGMSTLLGRLNLSWKWWQKRKKRVWRPQDWQKDRKRTTKVAKPQKGIWMKRHIHPVHKAEPARQKVQMKIFVVMAHRASFQGMGE